MAVRNGTRIALAVFLTLAVASGCGGGSSKSDSSGGTGEPTDSTIPLAKDNPTTKMFAAVNSFQSCLKGLNVKFIGAPDASDPSSPTNDPTYIKNLSTCAARSNIVQALADQQKATDNLSPEEIKTGNEGYLAWRDCMIGRGWGIPEPKPDSKGRLFSFGGAGSAPPPFVPPPGEDILSSGDTQECASEAQAKVPNALGS